MIMGVLVEMLILLSLNIIEFLLLLKHVQINIGDIGTEIFALIMRVEQFDGFFIGQIVDDYL